MPITGRIRLKVGVCTRAAQAVLNPSVGKRYIPRAFPMELQLGTIVDFRKAHKGGLW